MTLIQTIGPLKPGSTCSVMTPSPSHTPLITSTAAFPLTHPPSLTPDDVLDRLAAAINRKADAEQEISNCKEVLTLMRAEGLINDTVESEDLKLTWTTRSTWQYSNAVKSLQQMEQIEGVATKKQSSSWTAKQLSPKF